MCDKYTGSPLAFSGSPARVLANGTCGTALLQSAACSDEVTEAVPPAGSCVHSTRDPAPVTVSSA